MPRSLTKDLFQKSCNLIPGGVNSPVRAFQELQMLPLIVESGSGDTIQDVDGFKLIDYCMSWGALPFGHSFEKVAREVQNQTTLGFTFGISTRLELEMAFKIISHMPSIEKIRFVSSGTESTMSAIRLARGFTGKSVIVKFNGGYHGHSDSLLVQAGSGVSFLSKSSSLGVPKEGVSHTISLPYNDPEAVEKLLASRFDIAAVIVEPIAANMGLVPGQRSFLETLRQETEKAGALLIFDEVVSGFRVGLGGAQEYFGIKPDLTCLGKIIGGGLPAAAFGGKKEIMECLAPLGGVYQAGTLSGNPLAMRAGLATLKELERPMFYSDLQTKADFLFAPIEEWIAKNLDKKVRLHRFGSMFTFFFGAEKIECAEDLSGLNPKLFQSFYHYLFSQGIYLSPAQCETSFLSSAHTKESLKYTQQAILQFLKQV